MSGKSANEKSLTAVKLPKKPTTAKDFLGTST